MKRFLVGALWAFAFWYLGAALASISGLPDVIGPVTGLVAGGFVVSNPARLRLAANAHRA